MDSCGSPEDIRYEQILNSEGYPLKSFYTEPPADLLPIASSYPQFFQTNLLSPNRVIKTSRADVHSNLRIFYFHLLRLSYEIETTESGVNKAFLMNLRNYVLHPDFDILFTPETEPQRELYNDMQFKKLFCEFIYMLDQQDAPNTEHAVNSFPVIDEVMVHILRSILANEGHNQEFHARIDTNLAFSELSALLGLGLTPYGNCWKFDDSDIFCLQQDGRDLYLVYIVGEIDDGSEAQEAFEHAGDIPVYSSNDLPTDPLHQYAGYTGDTGYIGDAGYTGYSSSYDNRINGHYSQLETYQMPYSPDPLAKATESVPLIGQYGGYGLTDYPYGVTYTQSLNTFGSTDQFGLSRFAKDSGLPFDITPPSSDFDRGSANHRSNNLINKPQYDQFEPSYTHSKAAQINPKASMISMVSETYQFVDFTNTKTTYKEKVPRNKLKQNSPGPAHQPIVHLNREDLLQFHTRQNEADNFLSQFDAKKKISPVYESSTPTYDFSQSPSYSYADFSKPRAAYDYTPPTDVKHYSSSEKPPGYTATKANGAEAQSYVPSYTYQADAYRPLDTIFESVQTIKTEQIVSSAASSRLPVEGTPIYKLNNGIMYTESGRSAPQSADKLFLQAPMTASITGSSVQGDYYKDFTSSFTLEKLEEPFKANVRAIKNRIRGLKRGGLSSPVFGVGVPQSEQKPSFARVLYQDDAMESYGSRVS